MRTPPKETPETSIRSTRLDEHPYPPPPPPLPGQNPSSGLPDPTSPESQRNGRSKPDFGYQLGRAMFWTVFLCSGVGLAVYFFPIFKFYIEQNPVLLLSMLFFGSLYCLIVTRR